MRNRPVHLGLQFLDGHAGPPLIARFQVHDGLGHIERSGVGGGIGARYFRGHPDDLRELLDDLILLRGVARLSADLGMSVVVEGVETNEQLELISADGAVTEAQGYLFSRPVPAIQVRHLLNASHGRHPSQDRLMSVPSRSIA